MIYFISDLHFGHKNILKYETISRPFKNIEEMDKCLIENWNKKVKSHDTVYILGDFSFYKKNKTLEILHKLKGKKVLILGNHDNQIKNSIELRNEFIKICDYLELSLNQRKFVLFHYPMQSWNGKFRDTIHLYGHIHSNKGNKDMKLEYPNSYHVGVDTNNLTPISIDEILEYVNK